MNDETEMVIVDIGPADVMSNDRAKRADVIFAGVCIMKKIMSMLNVDYITVSEYDNLEGMIYLMM